VWTQKRYKLGEFRKQPVFSPELMPAHKFVDTTSFHKGKLSHQVLTKNAPHLKVFALHRLGGKGHLAGTWSEDLPAKPSAADTSFYFGLSGNCTVEAETSCGIPSVATLHDGFSVLVRNGAPHTVSGQCVFAAATFTSGPWLAHHVSAPDPNMVPSPCGAGGISLLRMTKTASLKPLPTAQDSDLLSKRLHLANGRIPGLLQVSVAKFMPGAKSENNTYSTVSEVYLHLRGDGCKLRATERDGSQSEHALFPSHFDVLHPGTSHVAWNDGTGPCENLNLMLADPAEVGSSGARVGNKVEPADRAMALLGQF
jgi:hypothetical protein